MPMPIWECQCCQLCCQLPMPVPCSPGPRDTPQQRLYAVSTTRGHHGNLGDFSDFPTTATAKSVFAQYLRNIKCKLCVILTIWPNTDHNGWFPEIRNGGTRNIQKYDIRPIVASGVWSHQVHFRKRGLNCWIFLKIAQKSAFSAFFQYWGTEIVAQIILC